MKPRDESSSVWLLILNINNSTDFHCRGASPITGILDTGRYGTGEEDLRSLPYADCTNFLTRIAPGIAIETKD